MNREILFRGKKADTGEWVYGYFERMNGYSYIVNENMRRVREAVIPETVGQFTGLTDKNGRKIFDGDIVRNVESGENGRVSYMTEYCAFLIYCKSANCYCWLYDTDFTKIEVIGNIHDNPELLEMEDENA